MCVGGRGGKILPKSKIFRRADRPIYPRPRLLLAVTSPILLSIMPAYIPCFSIGENVYDKMVVHLTFLSLGLTTFLTQNF